MIEHLKQTRTNPIKSIKEQEKLTFTKQLYGSYKYTMKIRTKGILGRVRRQVEKDKEENKKKMLGGWLGSIWSCLGYTVLALVMFVIVVPFFLLTYVRNQVAIGEFGHVPMNITQDINATSFAHGFAKATVDDDDEDFGD